MAEAMDSQRGFPSRFCVSKWSLWARYVEIGFLLR
jgi:hypothetical protein